MIYHYLMRPCIHDIAGKEKIKDVMSEYLDQFVDYRQIEDWFQFDKFTLHSLSDIDSLFDIKTNKDFKVIALYISPYKRFFSYYLASIETGNIMNSLSKEGFINFFENRDKLLLQGIIANLSDVYEEKDGLSITYKIEFDTLVEDLRKIPNLEFVPDDFIEFERNLLNQYRSYYTDEIKDWVSTMFAKDIQTYGYTF